MVQFNRIVKKDLKVSEHLYFQEVDAENGIRIGWNRFYPTLFIMNRYAEELLESLRVKKSIPQDEDTELFLQELYNYKFIYDSETDPSSTDFFHMVDGALKSLRTQGESFYREKKAPEVMTIVNDRCNLACPYCVNRYKRKYPAVDIDYQQKWEKVRESIRQYVERKLKNGVRQIALFFNGGEILLEWTLIRDTVLWLTKEYGDSHAGKNGIVFDFGLNTNLTLLTGEMARFLARHRFKINISIDGYDGIHDKTRKYHNGSGSFEHVLRGLELLQANFRKNPVQTFQGTIENVDQFEPEAVYKMTKYGFRAARLAPNLLGVSVEDALKKAELMGKMLELNKTNTFKVTEMFFDNARERINWERYRFVFNCNGLSCFPDPTLFLNVSTLRASLLCCFVGQAFISLDELGGDIFNPKLWQAAYPFIEARCEALKTHCRHCPLVGLCGGGCVYTGLDGENKINKAACAYQKKLWALYIKEVYNGNEEN